jgi:hypothetical protein
MSIIKESLFDIIRNDLNFIISFNSKYNFNTSSWYWRTLDETEDEWVQRRVKLCLDRNEIVGYVIGRIVNIDYKTPIDCFETTLKITKGSNTEIRRVPYNILYKTIEDIYKDNEDV